VYTLLNKGCSTGDVTQQLVLCSFKVRENNAPHIGTVSFNCRLRLDLHFSLFQQCITLRLCTVLLHYLILSSFRRTEHTCALFISYRSHMLAFAHQGSLFSLQSYSCNTSVLAKTFSTLCGLRGTWSSRMWRV
jgi:hypothetical protein